MLINCEQYWSEKIRVHQRLSAFLGLATLRCRHETPKILASYATPRFGTQFARCATMKTTTDMVDKPHSEEFEGDDPENLSQFVDHLVDETDGAKVSLGELLQTIGHRSYGPLLLLPALIAAAPPIGGIPGMSLITGSIIFLIAIQMLLGFDHPWLPKRLLDFEFNRDRLTSFQKKAKSWLRWLDKPLAKRWTALTEPPWVQLVALVCVLLAPLFVPLALLPMAVALPSIAICLMAIGLMARDGVVVAIGLAMSVAAVVLLMVFWPGEMISGWFS